MNKLEENGAYAAEQIIRAAWLYHVAGNTQERTAELLGISRVKVNRLLAEAKDSGIVRVSIEHRFARMVEVEEMIRKRTTFLSAVRGRHSCRTWEEAKGVCHPGRSWKGKVQSPAGRWAWSRRTCSERDYRPMRAA